MAVTAPRRRSGLAAQEAFFAYLFLAPWIIGFIVFIAGPMLASFYLSTTIYSLGRDPRFVGLFNFQRAFTEDPQFFNSVARTGQWAIFYVPLAIIGALFVAILLNQGMKGTTFYRTFFFLPHLTPIVASVFIWTYLFNPSFGLINETLFQLFRIHPGPGWFSTKEWAMPALVVMGLWGAIGGNMMLIFLAGLQGVPKDLYEVASIDGANAWHRFWNITLPMISPTLFFNFVLAMIAALQAFNNAFVATSGGPAYATWFYALHIYTVAFQFGEMGYASALAVIFFVALVSMTAAIFRLQRRWVYYAGEVK